MIPGQRMKPREVLEDRERRSEAAGRALIVRAGGSYSAHLNDPHHKLTGSLAGVTLTPTQPTPMMLRSVKKVLMSASGGADKSGTRRRFSETSVREL